MPIPFTTSAGFLTLTGAAVLLASGSVFIGAYGATVPPTLIAFVGFAGATLSAWLIPGGAPPPRPRRDLPLIAGANLATAAVFLSYYQALTLAEPALVAAAQAGSSPLFAAGTALLLPSLVAPKGGAPWIALGLVLVAVFLTIAVAVTDLSGLDVLNARTAAFGMMLAVISGASTYVLTVLLKALGKNGWSTVRIIRLRFMLIVLVTGWLVLKMPDGPAALGAVLTSFLLPLCLAYVALPMFLIQMSVLRLPIITVLMGVNAVPVLTYLFQLADGRIALSLWSLIATAMTTVGVVTYILSTRRQ